MKRFLLRIALPVAILAWAITACTAVDVAEYAYVTRFGQPVATYSGETEAGLQFKLPWPIDSVARVDRRLQCFDLPATEALTRDPVTGTVDKTLAVDAYVAWRVPDAAAVDRFVRSVGTPDQVKKVLAPQVLGRLASIIGGLSLDRILSVATPAEAERRANELQRQLLDPDWAANVRSQYGIEVVTIRVRRLSYPEAVRASIYERIRSERGRKVAEYENQGRKESSELVTKAEQERRKIEAEARATKQVLEGAADVEADRLRNEAYAKDPEFYAFLQRLKALQTSLAETRDVLLLSLNHDLFKLLKEPPAAEKPKDKP